MIRRVLAASALLFAGACHTRTFQVADGGRDAPAIDAPTADVPRPLAVDFAVTGCARHDIGEARCSGLAPLTVSFSPVSSPALTRFVWTFGDGAPTSTERAPTHTYALPGTYDVTLVAAGEVGSVSRTRARLIEVTPVRAGALCGVDGHCAAGLRCLCGAGDTCGPTFMRGICTAPCPTGTCAGAAVCATVDLPSGGANGPGDAGTPADDARDANGDAASDADANDAGAPADGAAPSAGARAPLCLIPCTDDAGCPAGLACRALPAPAPSAARWTRACVPPSFHEVGDTCRDASGQRDDRACASGTCAALGALGVCTASCGSGAPCPPGSACATFGNGQTLCLRTCGAAAPCTRDPLMRCEPAGGAGPLGFQISPAIPGATFCAPSACAAQADCAPAGTCAPLGAGGHCVRR
jgi:PKD repeat protein